MARRLALECKRRDAPPMRSSVMSRDTRGRTVSKPAIQGETANRMSVTGQSHSRAYNTEISEPPSRQWLVRCISLLDSLLIVTLSLGSSWRRRGLAPVGPGRLHRPEG